MATLFRTPAGRRADALVERVADNPALVLAADDGAAAGQAQPAARAQNPAEEPSARWH